MRQRVEKLNPNCLDVYDAVPEGSKNAVPLTEICRATGQGPREVRKCIQVLTSNGYPVFNLEKGCGYYKPDCEEDFFAAEKLTRSRTNALMRKSHGIKLALKRFLQGARGIDPEVRKSIVEKK